MQRRAWLRANRGVLTKLADSHKLSKSFVSDILAGRRRSFDGKVEEELLRRGAPGLTKRTVEEVYVDGTGRKL